jgi:hypothetical protein
MALPTAAAANPIPRLNTTNHQHSEREARPANTAYRRKVKVTAGPNFTCALDADIVVGQ